jgi:hypothetical protein
MRRTPSGEKLISTVEKVIELHLKNITFVSQMESNLVLSIITLHDRGFEVSPKPGNPTASEI